MERETQVRRVDNPLLLSLPSEVSNVIWGFLDVFDISSLSSCSINLSTLGRDIIDRDSLVTSEFVRYGICRACCKKLHSGSCYIPKKKEALRSARKRLIKGWKKLLTTQYIEMYVSKSDSFFMQRRAHLFNDDILKGLSRLRQPINRGQLFVDNWLNDIDKFTNGEFVNWFTNEIKSETKSLQYLAGKGIKWAEVIIEYNTKYTWFSTLCHLSTFAKYKLDYELQDDFSMGATSLCVFMKLDISPLKEIILKKLEDRRIKYNLLQRDFDREHLRSALRYHEVEFSRRRNRRRW